MYPTDSVFFTNVESDYWIYMNNLRNVKEHLMPETYDEYVYLNLIKDKIHMIPDPKQRLYNWFCFFIKR